jgi:hypothetical protein
MKSNLDSIGIIGGQKIYADTGQDHVQILQDEIRKQVERKQLTVGKSYMMRVAMGDKPVVVEITIHEDILLP